MPIFTRFGGWGKANRVFGNQYDGIDSVDYIKQIMFLKTADERAVTLPKNCDEPMLKLQSGTDLTDSYQDLLRTLGKESCLLGNIFAGARSRFSNPANLQRLMILIDNTREMDVKAQAV